MPRVAITPGAVVRTGTGLTEPTETNGDATNNHSVANDGRTVLRVRNSGAGARVLTVLVNKTIDGQAVTSRTYSIPAAGIRYIGPFDTTTYGTSLLLNPEHAELKIIALQISGV